MAAVLLLLLLAFYAKAVSAEPALASVSGPSVTGPIPGTPYLPLGPTFDLSQVGYQQSEFFLSGTAASYLPTAPLTSDGKWSVAPNKRAPYTTRMVVYRPIDPRKFNGTVVVEWLNVSSGFDIPPDWTMMHNELVRDGFIWVGVSAQGAGVQAAISNDPARYRGALSYPDSDSFSYDIFSQAGQAVRDDRALLGGLRPRHVIATGESQSAIRLVSYVDAVQPVAHVYDGFLVHSEFGTGAPLSQSPEATVVPPAPTHLRNDLDVPVFLVETETDIARATLFDRQPDTGLFRLWEIAGSAHFDNYGIAIGPGDTGNGQGAVLNLAGMLNPVPAPNECTLPFINTGGSHWNLNAAIYWLNKWVVNGIQPPEAPLIETSTTPGASPVDFVRDANGNVFGGVRNPQVDSPVAALGGVNTPAVSPPTPASAACALLGYTVPFSANKLAAVYPDHGKFVFSWYRATLNDAKAGFLLWPDAVELMRSAATSQVGKHAA
jgi:hypothetical protein